ncbi:MAG: Holliday junction resolvase RuvX [Saprospiraceae bacterium]|nr:Holliday junction resolvase RuvX [Saprospiraceae bacterium]
MARIMAIDYGTKRTGIAVSDPLQIIANGLNTVPTNTLMDFLEEYFKAEEVETIVIGEPRHADGNPTHVTPLVIGLERKLKKLYPEKTVLLQDEAFTSADARQIILQSGAKKKKRREKGLVDKISAVLILQAYMENQL